ncbi:L-fuculose-phosphate aldolase [Homoserinimonas aerilata]|uniref:L-fuculose-phosphate aldolase n=1 Tax=Homoserinimonas aerilata TaxID=1162970 RepID=A0A542YG59_9MICO|nr:class II aldolase/adducin family protein [Homoserinimonas aerilata]TQL46964.1 L-fuculose-phosphate aldolase [Homoserinimonas aerilata]
MTDKRNRLIEAGRELVDAGLSPGRSGNMSIRDGDTILMTPTNSSLGSLRADELSVVALDGTHLDGPRPSKEVPLHLAMYARDPRDTAVVHVHSASATALSCLEPWSAHTAIMPVTPYLLMKVGQVPLFPYFAPGDPRQADAIRSSPLEFRGALLANHGSIAAFPTLAQAQTAVGEIEEAAQTALLLHGRPYRLLDDAQIRELTTANGTPWTPAQAREGVATTV